MTPPETPPGAVALVMAKAPVPGQAKTRLAAGIGAAAAADLAAAALLDTLDACEGAFGADHVHVALAGDLGQAMRGAEIAARLGAMTVHRQRGDGFGQRLAHAHADAAGPGIPVVQVGMDTPQVTPAELRSVASQLATPGVDAVLGPAPDGGWWVLALNDPRHAAVLAEVPMSTEATGRLTEFALVAAGASVRRGAELCDIDTARDAVAVASTWPGLRFSIRWREVSSSLTASWEAT